MSGPRSINLITVTAVDHDSNGRLHGKPGYALDVTGLQDFINIHGREAGELLLRQQFDRAMQVALRMTRSGGADGQH